LKLIFFLPSGKSSLVATILRLLEIDNGSLIIDGLDVATIKRNAIRERLVVIPQDPLILSGSLRFNVDPTGMKSDSDIARVLDRVGLWGILQERGGLELEITAASLSKGQYQLLALARALLKRGKIILLDEATSNVDGQTDTMMQQVIREEFRDCTVLTVAHRINTIIDLDLIVVMDEGRIVETGKAEELLKRKGMFSKLVKGDKHDEAIQPAGQS
jgi:ATP-binding cassette, subfamily C (CFTR/MRP), member 1